MGAINVRGGRLQVDFRYRGVRCREQTRLPDNTRNRAKLRKVLDRIEAEITLDSFDYAKYFPNSRKLARIAEHDRQLRAIEHGTPGFQDFATIWFSEMEITWRDSHRATQSSTVETYLKPHFGDQPVSAIRREDVLKFRAALTKRKGRKGEFLSPARVNHIMCPLRMILDEAALRYDFVSPMQGIKGLPIPRSDVEPFSLEEMQLILKTVRPDYRNYYTVRFLTGMRTGEIDGLTWRHVDLPHSLILIRQSRVRGKLGPTKTDGSTRDIHMCEMVSAALRNQQAVTGKQGYVFRNASDGPLDHNNVTKRIWYPLLRFLELRRRTPYQTRHTAASLWLAAGENPEWVARQLGHTTTEMLFRRYSRYIPNVTRQDGSAMEAMLRNHLTSKSDQDIEGSS